LRLFKKSIRICPRITNYKNLSPQSTPRGGAATKRNHPLLYPVEYLNLLHRASPPPSRGRERVGGVFAF